MLHVTASNSGGRLRPKELAIKNGEENIKPEVPHSLTLGTRWRERSSTKIPV
jgi:hypothetical protein